MSFHLSGDSTGESAISVLGGSSPFTIELIDQLAEAADVSLGRLTLYGRDRRSLDAVAHYVRSRVDAPVLATTELAAALDGADVIVHQVRYGGLEGRAADAQLAAEAGIPADETLGPAGLAAALRTYAGTMAIGHEIAARCPAAWVINVTNPQGAAIAALHVGGVKRAVGVCELPAMTARWARQRAGLTGDSADWFYAGLNHRGFVYGASWLDDMIDALDVHQVINGIPGAIIKNLRAIPVKHFAMLVGGRPVDGIDRAARLYALRRRLLDELAQHPTARPVALRERPMPWYGEAVLPAFSALADGRRIVVTAVHPDGLPREAPSVLRPSGVHPLAQPPPPSVVASWLRRLESHERAVLNAVAAPSAGQFRRALSEDPLVPTDAVARLAKKLCEVSSRDIRQLY